MLCSKDISAIKMACPNLHHLGMDLDRNAKVGWPNKTIEAVLQTESLTALTFGLEIGAELHLDAERGQWAWNPEGLDGPGPFREPHMSLKVAEALFADLRAKKRGQELERAEFIVGDYTEVEHWGPLHVPSWEEGRARKFVCDAETSDESNAGHCQVVGDHEPEYVLEGSQDYMFWETEATSCKFFFPEDEAW